MEIRKRAEPGGVLSLGSFAMDVDEPGSPARTEFGRWDGSLRVSAALRSVRADERRLVEAFV